MASDKQPAAFNEIARGDRLSDKVAAALTESIVSGAFVVGDRLPSERELCEQFAVSRPVVREAVHSLVAKGLLAVSPRRGHVVAQLGPDVVAESITLYLRGHEPQYAKVAEVRAVLEIELAGLAAERATEEQLAAMGQALGLLQAGMSPQDAALADVQFHRSIAVATGNELFAIVLDSIQGVLVHVQLPTLAEPDILEYAQRAHAGIFARIAARDPDGARAAMRAHLEEARRQRSRVRTG